MSAILTPLPPKPKKSWKYISLHNRIAAVQVNTRLEQTVSVLADFPDMAQMSDEPGVRRMPVGRYPLLIFYTVENEEVVILHVRHTAREPWSIP